MFLINLTLEINFIKLLEIIGYNSNIRKINFLLNFTRKLIKYLFFNNINYLSQILVFFMLK